MAVKLNQHDLEFILKQIKIAEAHANGAALTEIRLDAQGNVITDAAQYGADGAYLGDPDAARAIPDPKTPFGLRTVDGSYNNLMEGREHWGAADQTMPRMLDPSFRDDEDGDTVPLGPPGGPVLTNTDYGQTGDVADADPRIISNLIVDMSLNNPAAIVAALVYAESDDPYTDLATIQQGQEDLAAVLADTAATEQQKADAQAAFDTLLEDFGIEVENGSVVIPNVAPDEGISAPFNAWMTFFGQFFDHGLDLITKGGNGTVYIPLQPDDPLVTHGPDGIAGSGDEVPAQMRFMVMTRATQVVGEDGSINHVNTTTPFVDQNQTYTSHASHQVFLREYALVGGVPVATGRLLEGQDGGLATWADVKQQARDVLGIELTDGDVLNIPLLRTDAYGEFIRGPNGLPQIILGIGADGVPNTDDDIVVEGDLAAPVNTFEATDGALTGAIRIGHAFLDDIAHLAHPKDSRTGLDKSRDEDGIVNDTNNDGFINVAAGEIALPENSYDGELLDRHFITGDGRGNENFGLTAVHHVFHSEHNRQVEVNKIAIIETGDLDFINEWLVTDLTEVPVLPTDPAARDAVIDGLTWDGERLFQTARFATEMQYQHLVFEEFARKIQPAIDPFVFNSVTDINPAIFSEFANTVYRFGHSMLTDSMPRVFADNAEEDNGLIAAFLNPVGFDNDGALSHAEAAGAIVRGLTGERGNEIDEFVVNALRNNLLGLPLDLAAINIARGRDTGVPTLNEAREQLFAATNSSFLKPYANWIEFAANLKNPLSIVNFIAAYGTHDSITGATGLDAKRMAAMELVFNQDMDGDGQIATDRADFLNGTGIYAEAKGGLDNVDLWIGGLAERILLFGGMLGSTFNAVFEAQMEALQDGDRFYYLTRTQGMNFLNELENNAFSKIIMANTDLSLPGPDGIQGTADDIVRHHIGVDSFAKYDHVLEANEQYQLEADPVGNDPVLEALGLGKVVRTNPDSGQSFYDTYLRFFGGEHVVLGGTAGNDVLIGDLGDDGIWGDAGDDYIEGGQGVDLILGGSGNDIILDEGDTGDFIKGEEGDDVIANSNGIDILMGGDGKDVVFVGVDDTEVFAGEGDDFVVGGDGVDFLLGNEGSDWLEGGAGFDTIAGDNSELFFNSTILGHDVMFAGSDENDFDAESGDDIMVQGESVMRNEGMFGFDWATFQGAQIDGYADMRIKIFTTDEEDILRNRFDKTEALSGWERNDTLIGDDRVAVDPAANPGNTVGANETAFFNDELSQAGVDRIDGLRALLGNLIDSAPAGATAAELEQLVAFDAGNILLGGGGSDTLEGNGGDDVLDGDQWLNVRIRITASGAENTQANEIATVSTLKHTFPDDFGIEAWQGKSLFELLVSRTVTPGQMHIVREILDGGEDGDIDIAVFNDDLENYTIAHNADGTTTVTHNVVSADIDPATGRNIVSDGTDTIRNVEILRFRDQDVSVNQPASGVPVITGMVTRGQLLTLDLSGISDANGTTTSTFAVQWQAQVGGTWTDIPGATLATFTPDVAQINLQLRAVVSFADDLGGEEQVVSAVTAPVGIHYVGTGTANVQSGTAGADILEGLGGADTLSGLGGDDIIDGGAGTDTLNGGGGNDQLSGGARADTLNGGDGNDALLGGAGQDELNGGDGDDTLTGGRAADAIDGGAGDDMIVWNANAVGTAHDGRDVVDGGTEGAAGDTFTITGNETAEHYTIWTKEAWLGFSAANASRAADLDPEAEIIVTRNGNGFGLIIAQLFEIEEIVINGTVASGGGSVDGDTFQLIGDFSATHLSTSTITIHGDAGDDVVDISALQSGHRIVFKSSGGHDTIIGTLRPQDVVELPPGANPADYTLTDNGNGTKTFASATHSVTFSGAVPPQFLVEDETEPPDGSSDFHLTASDLAGLKSLVNGQEIPGNDDSVPGVRTLSGHGNNVDNPNWGAADEHFIRLTEARYGDPDSDGNRATNPIFDGLDARDISNILGAQEAGLPKAEASNIFFMAFGQYFDHGLDFIPKGGNGVIEIGGPGAERAPGTDNPADLTRGTVDGYDENGVPLHVNKTSPYVDQNQAYGSHELVGQFLREGDGSGGLGSRLLAGGADPSAPQFSLLPTLRELIQHHWENNTVFHDASLPGGSISFRDYYSDYPLAEGATGTLLNAEGAFDPMVVSSLAGNFMGSGHALLLDTNPFVSLLDHYVAGDGRANENFALTSMHTIWARNHNFHVENLEAHGFDGTAEEVYQAAKMINEAEYQRVVFDEFADALLGGMRGSGSHGHDEYNPQADAGISHEFAAAAYRFGHSLIGQTITVLDENGQPKQVALFDAFLNPSNDSDVFTGPLPPGYVPQPGYEQLGVDSILGGIVDQPAEAVDFNIVDAVRNDLVRINADLFSFNVARARDLGLGTLNQIRADLMASQSPYIQEALGFAGDLSPYTSWEDFQERNGLSDAVIAQFKEAYPDLVLTPDQVAGFVAVNPDIELTDGVNGTKIVKGIDRLDVWVGGLAEKHINGGVVGQTFWVVIHEQLDRLQEGDRFYYTDRFDNFDFYEEFIDGQEFSDIIERNTGLTGLPESIFEVDDEDDGTGTGDDDDDEDDDGGTGGNDDDDDDDDDQDEDDDDNGEDDDQDDDGDDDGDDDDDEEDDDEDDDDDNAGNEDDDSQTAPLAARVGGDDADVFTGTSGDDTLIGRGGDDAFFAGDGADILRGDAGNDYLSGEAGRDVIFGGAGSDDLLGGAGGDMLYGDEGADRIFGGADNDLIEAGFGNDTVFAGSGDDMIVAKPGDGNDTYYGDEMEGGSGNDTLNMSALTADITADLGSGFMGMGSAFSTQSGNDTLWGIENIVTGSGDDVITASNSVNVMDGGAGADSFRFLSAANANGDTIVSFQPGDKIDLSGIDANSGLSGNQNFTLVSGAFSGASGELLVSFETRDGEDYTVVEGNTTGGDEADFKISIKGTQNLSESDFNL